MIEEKPESQETSPEQPARRASGKQKATAKIAPGGKPAPRKPPAKVSVRKRSRYSVAEVTEIFTRFRAANPEPKTELNYTNPFTLVVAVALSAQATDVGVNKATKALFEIADTPEKMLTLGETRLREMIKTIGLFSTKAKHVIALSRLLIERFGGEVPRDMESLVQLPGVGRKTANVVLNAAFGVPTIAVDTHIFRLGNRLDLAPGKTPDAVEAAFHRVIPTEFKRDAHHWLILHGRYICKARRPECEHCLIADLCKYPDKTSSVRFVPERYGAGPDQVASDGKTN